MGKKYRLTFMGLSLVLLIFIGWSIEKDFSFIISNFWFASGLLLLILLSLVDQPFFSKDSNIFVNGMTAALSLLLISKDERDPIFWAFLIMTVYLIVSSYVLMWVRSNSLADENRAIQFISRVNRILGRPEAIFSAFFLWGAVKQYTAVSNHYNALLWYWIVFMILNIPNVATTLESLFTKRARNNNSSAIGEIFGVQSKNTFLVKLADDRKESLNLFDFVEFQYSIDGKKRKGIVLDVYLLNQAQWIKVLTTAEINNMCSSSLENCKSDIVYKIMPPQDNDYLRRFVGVVIENSTIEKVRFLYSSKVDISAGQLIEASVTSHKILFQVVEGITKIEQLENKNQTGSIVGEAIQLGEWNTEQGRFEQFGWVPSINTPVFLASHIENPVMHTNEYCLGQIPETNYPVIIDKGIAVTHHTAILGVTGSGKSVFTRNLVHQIASDETKVIVVDLTGEYRERILNIVPIISDADAKMSFKAIEEIAKEKTQFANKQDLPYIAENEKIIKVAFHNSIKAFLEGEYDKAIFELPDISNSFDVLEYTRWFFWVLFQTARTEHSFGKRVCVVLEEAHTIIPEINSMGTADYASRATVNSIAQIALQGRKYNIGFIVVAQRTANVSKTVLTQCNSIIAFQELDKTSSDFLANYMGVEFVRALPNLKFRNAIAVGKAFRSTTPMLFEVPEINEVVKRSPREIV